MPGRQLSAVAQRYGAAFTAVVEGLALVLLAPRYGFHVVLERAARDHGTESATRFPSASAESTDTVTLNGQRVVHKSVCGRIV